MRKCAMFCISALMLFAFGNCESVQWMTNFDEAKEAAAAQNKPIVLFFTGTDWCVWCTKLESEALATKDFDQEAGSRFIFVKLDFPRGGRQSPELVTQNNELQKRFDVRGYPSIVLLNSDGRKIGSTGYKAGGGMSYASHLKQMAGLN